MSYNYTPGAAPPPGGPATPMTSAGGFQDIINSWMTSLTKPSIATYAAEAPRATQNRIMLSVGAAVVVSAVLGLLSGVISGHPIAGFISSLVLTAVGFAINVGAMYVGARIMKGTGTPL
ncbi:MAG TPA: hypothetical protein VKY74_11600, partial [Chloroflexia bacterium]|nr:hypothetical protein [Chloroflexia bacterium]